MALYFHNQVPAASDNMSIQEHLHYKFAELENVVPFQHLQNIEFQFS